MQLNLYKMFNLLKVINIIEYTSVTQKKQDQHFPDFRNLSLYNISKTRAEAPPPPLHIPAHPYFPPVLFKA